MRRHCYGYFFVDYYWLIRLQFKEKVPPPRLTALGLRREVEISYKQLWGRGMHDLWIDGGLLSDSQKGSLF